MVERRSPKPKVGGSSPSWPATIFAGNNWKELLRMNAKVETSEFRLDGLKWLLVAAIVVAGAVANSYYSDFSLLYRVLGLVAAGAVAAFLAINTAAGSSFWGLLREAQVEVRKVVWPSRQETNQTTLIVVAVVLVMAVVLWGLDTLLGWLASLIIG